MESSQLTVRINYQVFRPGFSILSGNYRFEVVQKAFNLSIFVFKSTEDQTTQMLI